PHLSLVTVVGNGGRCNSLEPNLPPVRVDASWTEHATLAVPGLTYYGFEDDAWTLHLLHLACPLIDDSRDTLEDAMRLTAVRNHLGIPIHATVLARGGHRSQNLFVRLDAHEFAGLQIKRLDRGGLPFGDRSTLPRKHRATPDESQLV